MVKVINPLFSNSARGRFCGLVYQGGRFGPFVKVHTLQHYSPTELQIEYNHAFGVCSQAWKELTPAEREEWNIKARNLPMSGFNLFVKKTFVPPE